MKTKFSLIFQDPNYALFRNRSFCCCCFPQTGSHVLDPVGLELTTTPPVSGYWTDDRREPTKRAVEFLTPNVNSPLTAWGWGRVG